MVMGQIPYPTDPEIRMMIAKMVARTEQKQGQDAAAPDPNAPQFQRLEDLLAGDQIRSLRTGTPAAAAWRRFKRSPRTSRTT